MLIPTNSTLSADRELKSAKLGDSYVHNLSFIGTLFAVQNPLGLIQTTMKLALFNNSDRGVMILAMNRVGFLRFNSTAKTLAIELFSEIPNALSEVQILPNQTPELIYLSKKQDTGNQVLTTNVLVTNYPSPTTSSSTTTTTTTTTTTNRTNTT